MHSCVNALLTGLLATQMVASSPLVVRGQTAENATETQSEPLQPVQAEDRLATEALDEDLEATRAELAAAGADISDLTPASLTRPIRAGSRSSLGRGSAWLRLEQGPTSGQGLSARCEVEVRWLRWRGRLRHRLQEGVLISQTLAVAGRSWRLQLGDLAPVHGYGLLIGRPGRGATLAVGHTLTAGGGGVRGWTGGEDRRAWQGCAVDWRLGPWSGTALTGRLPGQGDLQGRPVLVQLSYERGQTVGRLLMTRNQTEQGASLAGAWRTASWRCSWECALWRPAKGMPWSTVWQLCGVWHPDRTLRVELVLAAAPADVGPLLGRRPAILAGWNGRGWALRTYWRRWQELVIEAVVGRSDHAVRQNDPDREIQTLLDLQARVKLSATTSATIRFRRKDTEETGFSARFPWQAATTLQRGARSVLSLRLQRGQADWSTSILLRTMARSGQIAGQNDEQYSGRRSLLSVGGVWRASSWLSWRLTWTSAWGQDIDLVSAINPVTGFVLPRHWGKWRNEILCGCGLTRAGLELQVAASIRRPTFIVDPMSRPVVQLWARLAGRW